MTESSSNTKSYVDASPFVRLLETKSRVRMVDVFLGKHYEELTASEVADLADINQSSVSRNIDTLLEIGIIDKVGESTPQRYTLNKSHPVSNSLRDARMALFDHTEEIDSATEDLPVDPAQIETARENTGIEHLRDNMDINFTSDA